MLPAHQGLGADDAAAAQRDLGLVVQHELVALEGPPQLTLQVETEAGPRTHRHFEDLIPGPASFLGPVHGQVGVAQQVVGPVLTVVAQGDADAGAHEHLMAPEVDGPADVVDDALRHAGGLDFVFDLFEQHRELVAAHAGHRVLVAHRLAESRRHRHQQVVARLVTEAVVDDLEAVEVDEEDADRALATAGPGQGHLKPALEEGPVGQAGEGVVVRLAGQLVLEGPPLGDVALVGDDAAHGRITDQVRHADLEPAPLAIAAAAPHLELHEHTRRVDGTFDDVLGAALVLGVDVVQGVVTDALFGVVAEDALDGRALVHDRGVGREHGHHVKGVARQRLEALLAAANRVLLSLVGHLALVVEHGEGEGADRQYGDNGEVHQLPAPLQWPVELRRRLLGYRRPSAEVHRRVGHRLLPV
jgi:hypothetical protein